MIHQFTNYMELKMAAVAWSGLLCGTSFGRPESEGSSYRSINQSFLQPELRTHIYIYRAICHDSRVSKTLPYAVSCIGDKTVLVII